MEFLQENYEWLLVVALPAVVPLVTIGVEQFGSPKVKAGWCVVRRVYNKSHAKKMKAQGK